MSCLAQDITQNNIFVQEVIIFCDENKFIHVILFLMYSNTASGLIIFMQL